MAKRISVRDQWVDCDDDLIADAELRKLTAIPAARNLVRRTREGAFLVPRGSMVRILEGDTFDDAPARIKG